MVDGHPLEGAGATQVAFRLGHKEGRSGTHLGVLHVDCLELEGGDKMSIKGSVLLISILLISV